ncbi:MAG: M43 family zinc metalloprotease [Chitinophagales bacterium]
MRKLFTIISVTGAFLLSGSAVIAQSTQPCATDEMRKKAIENDPSILDREAAFNNFASHFDLSQCKIEGGNYIIPVVFHVIHDYGPENISDAQIIHAVELMNQDYSQTNIDFDETIPEFVDIAANVGFEFRLAQLQLSGSCTNGIERIPSLRTYTGGDAAKLHGWASGHYLNIWVVKTLDAGVAAYAYYPTTIGGILYTVDGIICRYDYVGNTGEAGPAALHTLGHEAGHYFNLQHTWGNNNDPGVECGDDQVPDTPITKGWTTCNLAGNNCGELENVQNFMDYSYCSTMFTEGQKLRMLAALNSADAMRNNLWTDENLILTGTNDGYVSPLCEPIADFYAEQRLICAGSSTTFHDVSYNAAVDSRSWTFEGGSPATSTETDPVVSFSDLGWHHVTLTVTNAAGENVKDESLYIYVSPETPTLDASYFENFNEEDEVMANWVFYNKYPDDREWKWRGNNGYWNTPCIWLNSLGGPDMEKDVVITPTFDLSAGIADRIYFKYSTTSYAPTDADLDMSLKMYYSNTCGNTWILMGTLTGSELITSYGGSGNFYPQFPDQWKSTSFTIPGAAQSDNVKFKIEFNYNNYVNNFFIDDFNFTTGVLDIQDNAPAIQTLLAPNPVAAGSDVNLFFNLQAAGNIQLEISDISGRVMASSDLGYQPAGSNSTSINTGAFDLTSGVYFITLYNETGKSVQQLILY